MLSVACACDVDIHTHKALTKTTTTTTTTSRTEFKPPLSLRVADGRHGGCTPRSDVGQTSQGTPAAIFPEVRGALSEDGAGAGTPPRRAAGGGAERGGGASFARRPTGTEDSSSGDAACQPGRAAGAAGVDPAAHRGADRRPRSHGADLRRSCATAGGTAGGCSGARRRVGEEAGGGGEEMAPDAYESARSPPAGEGFRAHFQAEKEEEEEEGSSRLSSSSSPSCSRCSALEIWTDSCPRIWQSLACLSCPWYAWFDSGYMFTSVYRGFWVISRRSYVKVDSNPSVRSLCPFTPAFADEVVAALVVDFSGLAGFAGDDAFCAAFPSVVVMPKMLGSMVGMTSRTVMRRHYAALVAVCGCGMFFCWFCWWMQFALCSQRLSAGSPPGVSTASCGRQFVHGVHAVGYSTLAVVVISQVQFLDKVIVCFTVAVVQTV